VILRIACAAPAFPELVGSLSDHILTCTTVLLVLIAAALIVEDLTTEIETNARRRIRTGFLLGHAASYPEHSEINAECENMLPVEWSHTRFPAYGAFST
jgi:hypothetical protein